MVGTALQGIGVLAVTPFATRALGPTQYGEVAVGLIAVQIVGTIAAAGLPQVILREHHDEDGGPVRARALSGAMLLLALASALVVSLVVVVVGLLIGESGSGLSAVVLVAFAAAGLTGVVAGQALLRAARRPVAFVVVALASTAVAQAAGLAMTLVSATALSFLFGYTVAMGLSAVLAALLARPGRPWRHRVAVRHGLALSAPLLPHGVAMLVLLMGDVVVVRLVQGAADAGRYQVALVLGNMPFVLATALYNAWGPIVMEHPRPVRWSWAAGTAVPLTAVIGAASAGVAALAPWLLAVVAPPSFDQKALVPVVAAMVLVAPTYMPYQLLSLGLLDASRTRRLALCGIGAAVVQVVGVTIGAATAGLVGAAVARWVAYLVLLVAVALSARTRPGIRLPTVSTVAVIGAAALVSLVCAELPDHALAARLALTALAGAAGLVALWVSRQALTTPSSPRPPRSPGR